MTDARLPGRWLMNTQIMGLSDRAWRVFTSALMWSTEQGTDGAIPRIAMRLLHPEDIPAETLDELEHAGLIQRDGEGGMRVLDWGRTQSTAAEIEQGREHARQRKRRQRERDAAKGHSGDVTRAVTRDVTAESLRLGKDRLGEARKGSIGSQETYSAHARENALEADPETGEIIDVPAVVPRGEYTWQTVDGVRRRVPVPA